MSQVLQESNVAEPHAASQTAKQATKQATAQPQERPSAREHRASSSAPRVSLAPAADRTLDILEFIAGNGQTQAATLARELGIPRSTVYQLLEILERHGLVMRLAEQRAYGIGLKTFELGSAYSRQHRYENGDYRRRAFIRSFHTICPCLRSSPLLRPRSS